MKNLILFCIIALIPVSSTFAQHANPIKGQKILSKKEILDGWIALFDGQTRFGWVPNKDINWRIKNNAITADSGPIGLIRTAVPFQDFELSVECKLEKGGNSGIFIRCQGDKNNPTKDCYEINIADKHPQGYLTGSIVGHTKTDQVFPLGDWIKIVVRADGPYITVSVNGKKTAQLTDEKAVYANRKIGYIGLQKNKGAVAFRNVTLRPTSFKPLFNGENLAGWNEIPGSKSKFTVDEGMIHCHNGLGFIETEKAYDNFLFQIHSKTHADELNSGVFFRSEKGTEKFPSNGYEMQIHNGFKEGDRNQPNNAGTGSIFRRTIARRIVGNDGEWQALTLVAWGPDFGIWVDGYMTTSWTDTRKPDDNPRRGLRTKAGHFSLQGHDPTTDLSFKRIEIQEYVR